MKEEEEKTKKKPNWALQVSTLSDNKFESLCIYREQWKLWLFSVGFKYRGISMMTNCLKKSFSLQNSLSTVSLGKLGEDGGEEGLDVEEEWGRDSMQTWTICLIVKLLFVQIDMCVFLLPVKDVNKFNTYLYSLVSNGKTANRKKTDKRHPYWLRPESTGFLIRQ